MCKEFLENKDAMEGVENTIDINSVDPAKFDADLPDNDKVNEAVAAIYEKGGIAAAVCHGPAGR